MPKARKDQRPDVLAANLARLRGDRNQEDIAATARLAQGQVSRYETSTHIPSLPVLVRLSVGLGQRLDAVIAGFDPEYDAMADRTLTDSLDTPKGVTGSDTGHGKNASGPLLPRKAGADASAVAVVRDQTRPVAPSPLDAQRIAQQIEELQSSATALRKAFVSWTRAAAIAKYRTKQRRAQRQQSPKRPPAGRPTGTESAARRVRR